MSNILNTIRRKAFFILCTALKLRHTAHTVSNQASRRCGNAIVGIASDANTYANWRVYLHSTEVREGGRLVPVHPEDRQKQVCVIVNRTGVHFVL